MLGSVKFCIIYCYSDSKIKNSLLVAYNISLIQPDISYQFDPVRKKYCKYKKYVAAFTAYLDLVAPNRAYG